MGRPERHRDAAGVEHQAVQGPGGAALVRQPREALDLGGLGDDARPDHRPVGLDRRVAEADRVEAVGGQQRREGLGGGGGADAVAAGDVLRVGLVGDVHLDHVNVEDLLDPLGDLVERGGQLDGSDRGEAAEPPRRVQPTEHPSLHPARHPWTPPRSDLDPPRVARPPRARADWAHRPPGTRLLVALFFVRCPICSRGVPTIDRGC